MKNKKKKKIIILITIVILLIVFSSCSYLLFVKADEPKQTNTTNKDVSTNQIEAKSPIHPSEATEEYTEIMGFGQLDINADYPNLYLINPSDNNVYLSFDVIYNDELLYQTGLIEPGKMEEFNIYNCLNAGEHTITYSISSFDLNNKETLWSGIKQKQEISIKK